MRVTSTGFDMGLGHRRTWHLDGAEIVRGQLGQPSKVLEEYQEWCDARSQGLWFLQAFELSDMVGALAACIYTDAKVRPLFECLCLAPVLPSGHVIQLGDAVDMFMRTWESDGDGAHELYRYAPWLKDSTPEVRRTAAASWLFASILSTASQIGIGANDLLSQAQLRSAIAANSGESE